MIMTTDSSTRSNVPRAAAVTLSVVIGAAIPLVSQQPNPGQATVPVPDSSEVLHTARAVVREGGSAGIVVKLDNAGRRDGGGPLFDLEEAARKVPPVPALRGSASDMLSRHLERSPRFAINDRVLSDAAARSCETFLNRRVSVDFTGHVFLAAVAVFNAATGLNVPAGAVGTCALGVAKGSSDQVHVFKAATVKEALNETVGQVSGVVWLAVEGTDGTCGVGLYGRDTPPTGAPPMTIGDDRFCLLQIAKVH